MARRKVKNGEKSPWGQCLTRPVPNSRRSSDFWLVPENTKVFWHQSEVRTAVTVGNWSGKILSPGALLAVLYFSSCHIFPLVSKTFPRLHYLPLGLRGWLNIAYWTQYFFAHSSFSRDPISSTFAHKLEPRYCNCQSLSSNLNMLFSVQKYWLLSIVILKNTYKLASWLIKALCNYYFIIKLLSLCVVMCTSVQHGR